MVRGVIEPYLAWLERRAESELHRHAGGRLDGIRVVTGGTIAHVYFDRGRMPLRFEELRAHIASLEAVGVDVVPLRVQLHHKLAYPFVCVVMTLLGIPFSFVVARRGALYGIGASIIIAIVYWACLTVFETLGNTARLPPSLAAWAPNIIFGALALYLVLNLET